jgi:hypothetical protein
MMLRRVNISDIFSSPPFGLFFTCELIAWLAIRNANPMQVTTYRLGFEAFAKSCDERPPL